MLIVEKRDCKNNPLFQILAFFRLNYFSMSHRNSSAGSVEVIFSLKVEQPPGQTESEAFNRVYQVMGSTDQLPGNVVMESFDDMLSFEGR